MTRRRFGTFGGLKRSVDDDLLMFMGFETKVVAQLHAIRLLLVQHLRRICLERVASSSTHSKETHAPPQTFKELQTRCSLLISQILFRHLQLFSLIKKEHLTEVQNILTFRHQIVRRQPQHSATRSSIWSNILDFCTHSASIFLNFHPAAFSTHATESRTFS